MKQYFKKLLQTFLFIGALIVLTALLCAFAFAVFFWVKPQIKVIILYFNLLLSTVLLLYSVFVKRYENKSLKAAYLKEVTEYDYSFKKDSCVTFKSKENAVHTLAFSSIVFANSARIAITTHMAFSDLLIQLAILVIIFTALNTLIWCCVHRNWIKGRTGTN